MEVKLCFAGIVKHNFITLKMNVMETSFGLMFYLKKNKAENDQEWPVIFELQLMEKYAK